MAENRAPRIGENVGAPQGPVRENVPDTRGAETSSTNSNGENVGENMEEKEGKNTGENVAEHRGNMGKNGVENIGRTGKNGVESRVNMGNNRVEKRGNMGNSELENIGHVENIGQLGDNGVENTANIGKSLDSWTEPEFEPMKASFCKGEREEDDTTAILRHVAHQHHHLSAQKAHTNRRSYLGENLKECRNPSPLTDFRQEGLNDKSVERELRVEKIASENELKNEQVDKGGSACNTHFISSNSFGISGNLHAPVEPRRNFGYHSAESRNREKGGNEGLAMCEKNFSNLAFICEGEGENKNASHKYNQNNMQIKKIPQKNSDENPNIIPISSRTSISFSQSRSAGDHNTAYYEDHMGVRKFAEPNCISLFPSREHAADSLAVPLAAVPTGESCACNTGKDRWQKKNQKNSDEKSPGRRSEHAFCTAVSIQNGYDQRADQQAKIDTENSRKNRPNQHIAKTNQFMYINDIQALDPCVYTHCYDRSHQTNNSAHQMQHEHQDSHNTLPSDLQGKETSDSKSPPPKYVQKYIQKNNGLRNSPSITSLNQLLLSPLTFALQPLPTQNTLILDDYETVGVFLNQMHNQSLRSCVVRHRKPSWRCFPTKSVTYSFADVRDFCYHVVRMQRMWRSLSFKEILKLITKDQIGKIANISRRSPFVHHHLNDSLAQVATAFRTCYRVPILDKNRLVRVMSPSDLLNIFSNEKIVKGIEASELFDLKGILNRPVMALSESESLLKGMMLMERHGYSALPVVSENHMQEVLGVMTVRDVKYLCVAQEKLPNADILNEPAIKFVRFVRQQGFMPSEPYAFLRENCGLAEILELFLKNQYKNTPTIRRIFLKDKNDEISGMVASSDLVLSLANFVQAFHSSANTYQHTA